MEDPKKPRSWMPRIDVLKMLFGFLLLIILGGLALFIGIGKVSQETSFGLEPIITTLATLAGAFAGWAFREHQLEVQQQGKPPVEGVQNDSGKK